jgi:hypothetical protein
MTGLLVLALFGLWVWAVFKLSRWIGGQVQGGRWRWPIAALVFLVFLPLPILDEIIGGFQFRALCKEKAVLTLNVDEASLKGKTVRDVVEPFNKDIAGTAVRISYSHYSYRDVEDGKELLNFAIFRAKGGWLVRTLSGQSDMTPLTFNRSTCSPLPKTDFGLKLTQDK